MKFYWKSLPILITVFLSYWAIGPLFHAGFFPMHDDTQVVRVQQMAQALRDRQFPVRWVGDLGYGFGYPIFNFYSPLAYYAGAFFNLVGFDALLATKLMFMIGILFSGVSMYLLAREFWGEVGGVVSGLFYVYAPYHAIQIYVRGAVGEFWATAFLPLVFLVVYKSFSLFHFTSQESRSACRQGRSLPRHLRGVFRLFPKWTVVGSLSLAAMILSHNLTAMMLVPILIVVLLYCYIVAKNKRLFIIHYSLLITSALVFSAFYWLPALVEMRFTKIFGQIGGGADFRDHFVFWDQLWASPWGFGGSAAGRLDGMSFMIGKLHLLVVLLAVVLVILSYLNHDRGSRRKRRKQFLGVLITLGVFILSIFFTNRISQSIWEAIPMMAFIQYPWRFLIFVALSASFLAGSIVKIPPPRWAHALLGRWDVLGGAVIIWALLFFNLKYFQPQFYNGFSNDDYINEENIKWKTSKISDEYLPQDFPVPENKNEVAWEKVAVLSGEAKIKNLVLKSHRYSFEVKVEDKAEVLVNLAYFPGWKVWIDGKEADFTLDKGKIVLSFPPGEHQISTRLTNTPIRTISNLISLVSWLGLVSFTLKKKVIAQGVKSVPPYPPAGEAGRWKR